MLRLTRAQREKLDLEYNGRYVCSTCCRHIQDPTRYLRHLAERHGQDPSEALRQLETREIASDEVKREASPRLPKEPKEFTVNKDGVICLDDSSGIVF